MPRSGAFLIPLLSPPSLSLRFDWPPATGHWPLSSPIMRPPSYRQRLFVEHYPGKSSGAAVAAARRAGYPWTEQMARKMLRNVEKRGVQAARNGPSEDGKCWQRIDLGIHSLKSWGRNLSRKVRETRSSSSQKRSEPAAMRRLETGTQLVFDSSCVPASVPKRISESSKS